MDEQRAHILDDLRGQLGGDPVFDPIRRGSSAVDGSLFEVDPLGVVAPRSRAELVALVGFAAARGIPLHPRGAGTNPFGAAIGRGLVVDFAAHLRRVLAVEDDAVVVQPGVVVEDLNRRLAPLGRRLWPDPPGGWSRTVGGLIGAGARGSRSLRYGSIAEAIVTAEVVFANGEVGRLGTRPLPEDATTAADEAFDASVTRRVAGLLRRYRADGAAPRRGYELDGVVQGHEIRMARLLAGSFGSLAMIIEATLRTAPLPVGQRVLIVPVPRLSEAAAAVADCLVEGASRCELFDWRALRLARDLDRFWLDALPAAAEAALLVEFTGDDAEVPAAAARAVVQRLRRGKARRFSIIEYSRRSDCDRALDLRRQVEPRLMTMRGRSRPVDLIPGLEAPPESWADVIGRLQGVFHAFDVNWTVHGCAGSGRLRARPFLDLGDPGDREKLGPLADAILEAAQEAGGPPLIDGRRGFAIRPADRSMSDLEIASREVKTIFDPADLLNPGVVVAGAPNAEPRPLRAAPASLPVIEPRLRWGERGPVEQANDCNGCGTCRSLDPLTRICPAFRVSRHEEDAPRAMTGLIRRVASGSLDRAHWGSEAVRRAADSCVHCRLCESECPSAIDVSGLMLEVKAAYADQHGLSPSEWFFSRIDDWARVAGRFPRLYNLFSRRPSLRWLMERSTGLSRHRALPRARRSPFLRRAERMGLTVPRPDRPGPRVAFFLDTVANHFDPNLAESVVAVLRHCGVNVYVPRRQRGCGMPSLVLGDIDRAREIALANLRALGGAVREGYTVVCSEPTAALMIRRDYLRLTDDLDAQLVAANTMDLGEYLRGLRGRGLLPTPRLPIGQRVGYHLPCHLRSMDLGMPGFELLRSIPELTVEHVDRGCSGMAGIFGLSRDHFRTSLRIGRGLRRRLMQADLDLGASECAACRSQMEFRTGTRAVHPVSLLAISYGLMPGLKRGIRGEG